ncbi:hypothetical protein B4Q13_15505 [Lacticaseibacillus rhamnosus]
MFRVGQAPHLNNVELERHGRSRQSRLRAPTERRLLAPGAAGKPRPQACSAGFECWYSWGVRLILHQRR